MIARFAAGMNIFPSRKGNRFAAVTNLVAARRHQYLVLWHAARKHRDDAAQIHFMHPVENPVDDAGVGG